MARRPPMKIAPSPSETPEHDAVRERERSSEAVQAKMREERTGGAVPPPGPTSLEDDTNGKAKVDKPASGPKTKKSKTAPKASADPKNMQAPAKAQTNTPESDAPAPRVEQRISVGVPVSLATSKALEKAAIKLGTDTDYIKRALLPKARAAFLKRAGANNLKATSKSMKLLFEQRIDNGVALMPVKLVVDDEIEARVRGFIPDPLDVISVNRLVAAFVGAEFDILVAAL